MENKQPKVSIGMPVRNGERSIKQAFDSLLAQEFTDFEIIISDNASTDKTGEICKQYMEKDNRIRYYRNEINIGMEANFKKVLDMATAPYFMWASHDDLWEPTYISEMVKVLDTNKSVVVAFSFSDEIDEEGKQIIDCSYKQVDIYSPKTLFKRLYKFISGNPWMCQPIILYGLMRTPVLKKISGMLNSKKLSEKRLNRGKYAIDNLIIFRLIFEGDFYITSNILFHHRSRKKTDDQYKINIASIIYFCGKFFEMFPDIHGYCSDLRKIIFASGLNFRQKLILSFRSILQEVELYLIGIIHNILRFFGIFSRKLIKYLDG